MRVNSDRLRLITVVNSSIAVGFLQGQLQYFQHRGFDATVLCPERRKDEWEVARPEGVPIIEVPMEPAGTFPFLSTEQITGPRLPQISRRRRRA
jgi:hypothetical protein